MSKFCAYDDGDHYHYGDVYENIVNKYFVGPKPKRRPKAKRSSKPNQLNITNNFYLNHGLDSPQREVYKYAFAKLECQERQLSLVNLLKHEFQLKGVDFYGAQDSKKGFYSIPQLYFLMSKTNLLKGKVPTCTYCVNPVMYQSPYRSEYATYTQRRPTVSFEASPKPSPVGSYGSYPRVDARTSYQAPQYYYPESVNYVEGESEDELEVDVAELDPEMYLPPSPNIQNQQPRYHIPTSPSNSSYARGSSVGSMEQMIWEHRERQFQRKLYHRQLQERLQILRSQGRRSLGNYKSALMHEHMVAQNSRGSETAYAERRKIIPRAFELHSPLEEVRQYEPPRPIRRTPAPEPTRMAPAPEPPKPTYQPAVPKHQPNFAVAYDQHGNKYYGSPKNMRQIIPSFKIAEPKRPTSPPSNAPRPVRESKYDQQKKKVHYYSSIPEEQQLQQTSSSEVPTKEKPEDTETPNQPEPKANEKPSQPLDAEPIHENPPTEETPEEAPKASKSKRPRSKSLKREPSSKHSQDQDTSLEQDVVLRIDNIQSGFQFPMDAIQPKRKPKKKKRERHEVKAFISDQSSTEMVPDRNYKLFMAPSAALKSSSTSTTQSKVSIDADGSSSPTRTTAKQSFRENPENELKILMAKAETVPNVETETEFELGVMSNCSHVTSTSDKSQREIVQQPRERLSEQHTNKDKSVSESTTSRLSKSVPETNKVLQYTIFSLTEVRCDRGENSDLKNPVKVKTPETSCMAETRALENPTVPENPSVSKNPTLAGLENPDVEEANQRKDEPPCLAKQSPTHSSHSRRRSSRQICDKPVQRTASSNSSLRSVRTSSRKSLVSLLPVKHCKSVEGHYVLQGAESRHASEFSFGKNFGQLVDKGSLLKVQGDQQSRSSVTSAKQRCSRKESNACQGKPQPPRSLVRVVFYPVICVYIFFRNFLTRCIRLIFFR